MLRRERPSLGDFIDTDDTVVVAALKRWGQFSIDPVLKFLAKSLIERRLFKEVRIDNPERPEVRKVVRSVVKKALASKMASDLPVLDAGDEQALDYFVLVDTCTFKTHGSFDGILFDRGSAKRPQPSKNFRKDLNTTSEADSQRSPGREYSFRLTFWAA
jgi:hypothetical protein